MAWLNTERHGKPFNCFDTDGSLSALNERNMRSMQLGRLGRSADAGADHRDGDAIRPLVFQGQQYPFTMRQGGLRHGLPFMGSGKPAQPNAGASA